MVTLYAGGQKVGTLADAERLIPELVARNIAVELRDEGGKVVGTLIPKHPPVPSEPLVPWDPSITQADIDRILTEPAFTFDEVKKRLGWE